MVCSAFNQQPALACSGRASHWQDETFHPFGSFGTPQQLVSQAPAQGFANLTTPRIDNLPWRRTGRCGAPPLNRGSMTVTRTVGDGRPALQRYAVPDSIRGAHT